jgi:hypothetical protein
VQRLQERFEKERRDLRAEIESKIDERAATVLFVRLLEEAIESPTSDRLRLMCAGMAGVIAPDLDVEMKSRVTRAVAMLEPSDVLALRRLTADDDMILHKARHPDAVAALYDPKVSPVTWQALSRAGCVDPTTKIDERAFARAIEGEGTLRRGLHHSYALADVGRAVVKFLATAQDVDLTSNVEG